MKGRIAALAAVAALTAAGEARAADYCVGVTLPACEQRDDLAAALASAVGAAGADRVFLGAGEHQVPAGPADADGSPVEIAGSADGVVLAGPVELGQSASRLAGLQATGAVVTAGVLREVAAGGGVELLPGGRLADSSVAGGILARTGARVERSIVRGVLRTEGDVVAEDLDVVVDSAAAGLDATCGTLTARHVTLTGSAGVALRAACAEGEAALQLRNSVVHGDFTEIRSGAVATAFSALDLADPGFVSATDRRPAAGSPLIDAADPEPLVAGEGSFDARREMRIVDGDGDALARRDIGAYERQPAAPPLPAGNVLANPGAEAGAPGEPPPGWTRMGDISTLAYGTVDRTPSGADVVMPTKAAAAALDAGGALFSGDGTLLQRIDVAASAPQIDTGAASAALSGLVGGFGSDEDRVVVTATFRDPEGAALGSIALGPVPAAERSNATSLVPRAGGAAIPVRTRAIDVTITGTRVSAPGSGETYTDAFADRLALTLTVPGTPVPGPVDPGTPPVQGLKPFSGITVLTARPGLTRRGRVRVRVACASATVGRCTGTLELRAQLRRGQAFTRVTQFERFSVAPGRASTRTLKVITTARRTLYARRSFLATLRAVVQDGQGLERRRTIVVRVRRR